MFGCCYLPGLPHRLAAAGPADRVSLFNVGTAVPLSSGSSSSSHAPAAALFAQGVPSRQLLCLACAADGSAMAASGGQTACPPQFS